APLLLHHEPLRAGADAGARDRQRAARDDRAAPGPGAPADGPGHDDVPGPRRGGDGGVRPRVRPAPLLAVPPARRRLSPGPHAAPPRRRPPRATAKVSTTHGGLPDNGAHGVG